MKVAPSKKITFSAQVSKPRYVYLANRIGKTPGFKVACAGIEHCNPDYRVERKTFSCIGIELVIAGRGHVTLNGKSRPLHPGALFCYGSRTPHTIVTDPRTPLVKYFVDFFGDQATALLRRSRIQPGEAVYVLEIESFRTLFELIIAEGAKGLPSSQEICAACLKTLILKSNEAIPSPVASLGRAATSFQRCRDLIDAHYLRLRSLGDIARECHASPAYLCRLFQKFGNQSPFHYLIRRKLNRAAELLMSEGRTVKEAAMEVGFFDPGHFSRVFKQHFGEPPASLRYSRNLHLAE